MNTPSQVTHATGPGGLLAPSALCGADTHGFSLRMTQVAADVDCRVCLDLLS